MNCSKPKGYDKIPEELGIKSTLPAPAPAHEQASSKSSRNKRKHMELEPGIKIPGFSGLYGSSYVNARFNMKLKKLIVEHPDQETLKSKKVKLEALRYEMN
ncbi:hypothetical protein Tco_0091222 [Tanacetum coccineum]